MNQAHHIPVPVRIAAIRHLAADTSLFTLQIEDDSLSERLKVFIPGQFLQLSVPGGGEIPLSPAELPDSKEILFCVRRTGHVTDLLHQAVVGDPLGLRGPFGKGFPVKGMQGGDILILAGGLGIVPLLSLLRHLLRQRGSFGTITLLYGAREPGVILFREELMALHQHGDLELRLTVDFIQGELPAGFTCTVGLLPELLGQLSVALDSSWVAICGPPPMYRCVVEPLLVAGCPPARILLSLERRMQCGVGRCAHCAVGHLLCCSDGPVFSWQELMAIPEAI